MAITVDELDKALARWNTRLKRAVNTIDKLQKRRKRLVVKVAVQARPVEAAAVPSTKPPADTDTGIPDFLKRDKSDPVADQIRQEQADLKRAKAKGRIAKMKAKQSGETRKMPLTGKAALEAIRNG